MKSPLANMEHKTGKAESFDDILEWEDMVWKAIFEN